MPPTEQLLALPLPRFRQPISDPPLPEVTGDPGPTTEPPASPSTSSPRSGLDSPEPSPAPPPVLSPERPARTATSSAGDPKVAYQVFAGLIAIGCLWAYTLFGRRGLHFRQPSQRQVDGIANPLGRLVARHLPTDVIGPDLIDATEAAAAAHHYIIDGPLITRMDYASPEEAS